MTYDIKDIKYLQIHKDFGFKQVKCLDRLNSKLTDDKIFCYEWSVFVYVTHARICDRFVSKKRINKHRKRRKEVIKYE